MIQIKFPDGSVREFNSGVTPFEVASTISEGLARNALGAVVNGDYFEINHPIRENADVKIATFNDDDGKQMFWHSSAHLMAEALQQLYPGTKFGIGPSIENGFYYDVDLPEGTKITTEDLPEIEKKMKELAKMNSTYNMSESTWEDAMQYYTEIGNEYKIELIEGLKGEQITFCKHGSFTDLCRGGHIPNTGLIKAVKLLSVAGAYWRGNSDNKMMTRIYGITFPKQKLLDEYMVLREEAERRDHRKLGKELELYMITPTIGGGLPVWLPKGTIIRRILEDFLKKELIKRGYQEVITPHIGNLNLYKTSGHYPYYSDSQFSPIKVEEEEYMLKPMNCPHHHQIYASKPRSYRDLPLRLAEFGTVYRYEQSGELSGLSRVRGFTQDDAHIYCTHEQLKSELINAVELTQLVFNTFGMQVTTRLSFRDDESNKFAGDPAYWEQAEREIKEVADSMGLDYFIGLGEASFYGPKIDFIVRDAIGRKWQLGTVQVDYVMPERFGLEYMGNDNQKHRPVIIHRAPFGSMERFISILIEHYAGNFPFWIAPVQISILPIGENQNEYCENLYKKLKEMGYRVEIDTRSEKVNRKIAESEQMKVPFAIIAGQKEVDSNTVSLRQHGKGDLGSKSIHEVLAIFAELNQPTKSIIE
ncbi:MAG: threonine--tRNA ligase [Candidatus Kapabacteria bacterium]|nr:threonine--tRNA ligase [Ignavibacteriota bacterium]MCW5883478.1 threonine--tRNA ligase [Candidatus Kapabacteria bacterium]